MDKRQESEDLFRVLKGKDDEILLLMLLWFGNELLDRHYRRVKEKERSNKNAKDLI